MTAVGVFNGNWRGEEMREYLNGVRSDNKKLAELGTCGHELGSRPMWMIGKSQLCYACYYNEEQEQRRILDNITEEAQAEYFAGAFELEGSDNSMSGQWREHGYY